MRLAPVMLCALFVAAASVPVAPAGDRPPVREFAIVVTGGELLAGVYADGHTQFLAGTLRPLGWRCVGSISVDDSPQAIQDAVRFELERAALVIVTGGLGPTDNDRTRETLSKLTGIPLREEPAVLDSLAQRVGAAADQLPANQRRQSLVPQQGQYLPNPRGTAVGLVFQWGAQTIVALPGPPGELRPMVLDQLVPLLNREFGTGVLGRSVTLRFVGLGQSQIDHTLEEHLDLPDDLTTFSNFAGGRVDFTFALPEGAPQAEERLRELKEGILAQLGDNIYADDLRISLEQCVVRLLEGQDASLSIAEVGTGGVLSAGLVAADPQGDVVAGAYLAPTESHLAQVVGIDQATWSTFATGAARTEALAGAVRRQTGSQWVLVVLGGRPGVGQPGDITAGFGRPGTTWLARRFRLRATTLDARRRVATQVLDSLRRHLLQVASTGAGQASSGQE